VSEVKKFAEYWNMNYPVDRWWRKKHKIAFNSSAHRVACLIDMELEFVEDKMYVEMYEYFKNDDKYIPGMKDIFKKQTEQEIEENDYMSDEEFMNIDLSIFDKKKKEESE